MELAQVHEPGARFLELAERNFIGGEWRFTREGYAFDVYDPRRSTVIAAVPLSTHRDVRAALAAARAALPGWSGLRAEERSARVDAALAVLEREIDAVVAVISSDCGLPPACARRDTLEVLAEARREVRRPGDAERPGVIGQILSWSNPLAVSLGLLAPDLARGHVAVVRPSLRAPLALVCLADALDRAGVPGGVMNLVQGAGVDAGSALAGSADLDRLDFQGSQGTERRVTLGARRRGIEVRTSLRQVARLDLADEATVARELPRIAESALCHVARPGFGGLEVRVPRAEIDAVVAGLAAAWSPVAYLPTEDSAPLVAPFTAEKHRAAAEAAREAHLRLGARVVARARAPDARTRRMGWFLEPVLLHDPEDAVVLEPDQPHGPLVLLKTL